MKILDMGKTLLCIWMLFCYSNINAQDFDKCDLMAEFLNSPQILNKLRFERMSDSIILIDKSGLFANSCISFKWKNSYVKISHNSDILKALDTVDAHGLFIVKCEYYILEKLKNVGKYKNLSIFHGCSNVVVRVRYLLSRKNFQLKNVSASVY